MTNKYYLNYYEPRMRELCHAVKECDLDAAKDAANMLLDMDILRCKPRETLYALKKRGIGVSNAGIYSLTAVPNGRLVYLIDNVIDTGSTVMSAGQALGVNYHTP